MLFYFVPGFAVLYFEKTKIAQKPEAIQEGVYTVVFSADRYDQNRVRKKTLAAVLRTRSGFGLDPFGREVLSCANRGNQRVHLLTC